MIGLQEIVMQTVGDAILLFPAWPRDWDVDFRLHAPNRTIVKAELRGGRIIRAETFPFSQRARLVLPDWASA
jgi:hypothetical protein